MNDESYLPIRIKTLRPSSLVNFDLFIPVGKRMVHYMRENDPIDQNRLVSLKEKKVKKLFIPVPQEDQYLDYLDIGLGELTTKDAPIEEKAGMVNDTLVTAAENAEKSLETEKGYNRTKDQFGKITDFLMSEKGALKKIMGSAGMSEDDHQHAASVSSLSLGLATSTGELDSMAMMELGIAALVRDISLKKLDFNTLIPIDQLTPDQLKKYKQHPQDSADILSGKPFISPRILGLVADHEEYGEGRGFPNKKDYFKLKMPYKILNLCNAFDRYCIDKKYESHQKALDPFYDDLGDFFDDELYGQLVTILQ